MITLRKSEDRGYADHGWLKSFHSFSFADYHDPAHMGFGNLRVINEDRIAAGTGFGTHGHRDMEIISYVLDGALAHQDSMGTGTGPRTAGDANTGVIRPGDVQRMTAGTGVRHSEFNHAKDHGTHFLQIWLLPSRAGLPPSYEQAHFDDARKRGRWCLLASPDAADGAITLHADARVHAGLFDGDEAAKLALDPRRLAYVHVVRGRVQVNGQSVAAGDALMLRDEAELTVSHGQQAELLFFDLAALH